MVAVDGRTVDIPPSVANPDGLGGCRSIENHLAMCKVSRPNNVVKRSALRDVLAQGLAVCRIGCIAIRPTEPTQIGDIAATEAASPINQTFVTGIIARQLILPRRAVRVQKQRRSDYKAPYMILNLGGRTGEIGCIVVVRFDSFIQHEHV
jgi:hypothetical protein